MILRSSGLRRTWSGAFGFRLGTQSEKPYEGWACVYAELCTGDPNSMSNLNPALNGKHRNLKPLKPLSSIKSKSANVGGASLN